MNRLIEDIKKVIDSHLPYRQIVSIPIDKLLFHYLKINGVYILYSKNDVVYIGTSKNIGGRLSCHIYSNNLYGKEITKIEVIRLGKNINPLEIESRLIIEFKPDYNKTNGWTGFASLPENFDLDEAINHIRKNTYKKLGMDK